jgi:hypothetical protein
MKYRAESLTPTFADIAKVLLASPGLRFLGLSIVLEQGDNSIPLWSLIEYFDLHRKSVG